MRSPNGSWRLVAGRPGAQDLDRGLEIVGIGRDVRVQVGQADEHSQFVLGVRQVGGQGRDDRLDLRQDGRDDVGRRRGGHGVTECTTVMCDDCMTSAIDGWPDCHVVPLD